MKELTRKRKTEQIKREDHEVLADVLQLLSQLAEKRTHIVFVIDEIDAFSKIQSSQTLFMYLLRNLLSRKKLPVEHEIKSLNRKIVASKAFPTIKIKSDIAVTFIGIANSVELF
jgi:Cdc6-like AAA superfamily ATPase